MHPNRICIVGTPAAFAKPKSLRHKYTPAVDVNGRSRADVQAIIDTIEDTRKLPKGSIRSRIQTHLVVEARHDAMAEVYLHFLAKGRRLSLQQLGQMFERDITTVHYALGKKGVVIE
jgi:chromosomal replication initiation ATPase DnaA